MSHADREAALKALHDAEAALAAAEKAETSTSVGESSAEAPGAPPVHTTVTGTAPAEKVKYLDLGPQYLGPVAINGT